MEKVLLLSAPFGSLDRPALGISSLKARLTELDIPCDLRYLTFTFAELVGIDAYRLIAADIPYPAFAGDWTFTPALYGEPPGPDERYIDEVLREKWRVDESKIQTILRVRSLVMPFIEHCMIVVPWEEYSIVGFTSTFEQNVASLALAKRIKATHPNITIVFGGANWEGEMGHELHNQFQFVDYVCSGESERSFPTLVQRVFAGKAVDGISGIVYRENGASVYTGPPDLIREVDALPIPDFSDYLTDISQSTVGASVIPVVLLETSRGCWWGAKSHCTFCGLNGGAMTYRSKSAERALSELKYQVKQWDHDYVEVVDNILDMGYFDDFLPALAQSDWSGSLFFEVKANLSRDQIRILSDAGVNRIQPGIESLSNHVLKLMRKGITGIRNIQLLKWCKEYNISVDWNILYGFPGETQEDYDELLQLLSFIRFLDPPHACGPVRLDRFSPYFDAPQDYGMINPRPLASYGFIYPFDEVSLSRIAYVFDYDYEPGVDPTGYADRVARYVYEWKNSPQNGTISAVSESEDTLILLDSRPNSSRAETKLTGMKKSAYEFCDAMHTLPAVARHLQERYPDAQFTEQQIQLFFDALIANKLMVTDGTYYLSLAIPVHRLESVTSNHSAFSVSSDNGDALASKRYVLPMRDSRVAAE